MAGNSLGLSDNYGDILLEPRTTHDYLDAIGAPSAWYIRSRSALARIGPIGSFDGGGVCQAFPPMTRSCYPRLSRGDSEEVRFGPTAAASATPEPGACCRRNKRPPRIVSAARLSFPLSLPRSCPQSFYDTTQLRSELPPQPIGISTATFRAGEGT